jgi:hypothetical protein
MLDMSVSVMNPVVEEPDPLLEPEDAAVLEPPAPVVAPAPPDAPDAPVPPDAPDDAADPVDDETDEDPPPLTLWPTVPLIAVTTPAAGAVSTVPLTAFMALASDACADAMLAVAASTCPACGGALFTASAASVVCC